MALRWELEDWWRHRHAILGDGAVGPDDFLGRTAASQLAELTALFSIRLDQWLSTVFPQGVCRLLDYGCGWGRLKMVLHRHAVEYVGVDLCEQPIERAAARWSQDESTSWYVLADVGKAPPNVDLFFTAFVQQHLPPEELAAVAEFARRSDAEDVFYVEQIGPNALAGPRTWCHQLQRYSDMLPEYKFRTVGMWSPRPQVMHGAFHGERRGKGKPSDLKGEGIWLTKRGRLATEEPGPLSGSRERLSSAHVGKF